MRARFAGLCFALSLVVGGLAAPPVARAQTDVDLELVLAVDVSYSMDYDELALQRGGYVEAFRSAVIHKAIASGAVGRIAVTYIEWAGAFDQKVVVDWTIIDSKESAEAFALQVEKAPLRRSYRTSIAGVIDFSVPKFGEKGISGTRRVIDISGDGPNNQGRLVLKAREEALAKGITINGLPILLKRPGYLDVQNLDDYYRDCVIGGKGSFQIAIRERHEFADATRTKLLYEIADMQPQEEPRIHFAQVEKPRRADCEIGERMWRERWERGG
jgi:hypothetical protein